jgi:hypothetical protein
MRLSLFFESGFSSFLTFAPIQIIPKTKAFHSALKFLSLSFIYFYASVTLMRVTKKGDKSLLVVNIPGLGLVERKR